MTMPGDLAARTGCLLGYAYFYKGLFDALYDPYMFNCIHTCV